MWHRIRALMRKEFLALLKDKRSRFVLIVPPIIQVLVFGYAATFRARRDPSDDCAARAAAHSAARQPGGQCTAHSAAEIRARAPRGGAQPGPPERRDPPRNGKRSRSRAAHGQQSPTRHRARLRRWPAAGKIPERHGKRSQVLTRVADLGLFQSLAKVGYEVVAVLDAD